MATWKQQTILQIPDHSDPERTSPDATLHRHFDSYAEFVDYIEALDYKEGWGDQSWNCRGEYTWTLGKSFLQARKMATEGWPEGRERMAGQMSEALASHELMESREDWMNDHWGFAPNVDAYLAGHPRHMLRPETIEQPTDRVVRLRVNLACSATVDGEQKATWGTAVAFLVDQLENCGKQVEVTACYLIEGAARIEGSNSRTDCGSYLNTIVLKAAGEPLDLDRLAFMVAHPAAHRRLLFKLREAEQELCTYGGPSRLPRVIDTLEECDEEVVTIEGVEFNQKYARTVDAAIERVTAIYNEQCNLQSET